MTRTAFVASIVVVAACANTMTSTDTTSTGATSTQAGFEAAKWGSNVTVRFSNGSLRYRSNGLPSHSRPAEYALPNGGGGIPTASTSHAGVDPTRSQSYDFTIPLTPIKAASPTSTSLGTIGLMISGAALFNPYEGDGITVAMASNFTVKNSAGQDVAFLDACNGHPSPMGAYHYHALPPCVTATVDVTGGPSHIIGIAFDGYPIYGDRDINGKQLTVSDLDQCSGITSSTPEFPNGIYHYVLLNTASSSSSIRCFMGKVSASYAAMSMSMSMTTK